MTPRRRVLALAVGALVLVAGSGYLAWRILTRESATPVSARAAVARFRAGGAAARTLAPALRGRAPEPGVYLYATRGFERTKVLGGTRRHAYPPRTTMTVRAAGCGLAIRWDALETRWDAVQACPPPHRGAGWRLAATSEGHAFLGHLDERTYRCTPASAYLPARLAAGARWASRCAIEGTTTADRGVVAGPRTLAVGGRRVRTLLLRTRTRVSGDTTGAGATFTWIVPRTGLVVRRVVANASTTGTIAGDVDYVERYAIALTSLTPLR